MNSLFSSKFVSLSFSTARLNVPLSTPHMYHCVTARTDAVLGVLCSNASSPKLSPILMSFMRTSFIIISAVPLAIIK